MTRWTAVVVLAASAAPAADTPNYAEALQKAVYFYDCQRSGKLPPGFRVGWRGDSCLADGADVGRDLSGGWFDAGDHVKSNVSTGYALAVLAWGLVEHPEAYRLTGQDKPLLAALRHAADFSLRCFAEDRPGKYEFYVQVGKTEGDRNDHSVWVPAEVVHLVTDRPSWKITTDVPGMDVAGNTAAGWAACSVAFRNAGDRAFADRLLEQARKLFRFADDHRGPPGKHVGPDGKVGTGALYRDEKPGLDKLAWAAVWLHLAETAARSPGYDDAYLKKAREVVRSAEYASEYLGKHWAEFGMFRVDKGVSLLLARLTADAAATDEVNHYLDWWTVGRGDRVKYTPGGLAWRQDWGPLRFAVNTSWFALLWADHRAAADRDRADRLRAFAARQVGYVLGDNPQKRSYLLGYGTNPWPVAHHRTAHGPWAGWEHFDRSKPEYLPRMRHTLYGGMLGGPDDQDRFTPDIKDAKQNEVALDYQAALPGCLARLWLDRRDGKPFPDFPPPEVPEPELFVEASAGQAGPGRLELACRLTNRSAWPAQTLDKPGFRYRGIVAPGGKPTDFTATASDGATAVVKADGAEGFVVDVTLPQRRLFPGGLDAAYNWRPFFAGTTTLTVVGPAGWDPKADPSGRWLGDEDANRTKRRPTLTVTGNGKAIAVRGQ